jgi:hypothetical protein
MNLIGLISILIFNFLTSMPSKFNASLFDPGASSGFLFRGGQEFAVIGIFLPLLHFIAVFFRCVCTSVSFLNVCADCSSKSYSFAQK